jgi:hypothetical protein
MGGEVVPDAVIAEIASRQEGVVSRPQLIAGGLTHRQIDRRIASGRLQVIFRGVYAVGHRALGARGRWWAAVLAGGDDASISHFTAGHAWEVRLSGATVIDVSVGRGGRRARPGIRFHCRDSLTAADVTTLDGLPITTPARTVLDLAASGVRGVKLESVVEQAEQRYLDFSDLDDLMQRCAGQPGTAALREVLGRYAPGSLDVRSRLEAMCIELCDAHGIPRPSTNVVVAGRVRDLYWPHMPLVVEADSYRWHRGPSRLTEDRVRDAELTLARIPFVRFTYDQVADQPRYVSETVRTMLGTTSPPMR